MVLCLLARVTYGGDLAEVVPVEKERFRWMRDFYWRVATDYDIRFRDRRETKLELQKSPVLYWISGIDFDGAAFVWTRGGRPEVVGSIFSWGAANSTRRNVKGDFYCFSLDPVTIISPQRIRWEPPPLESLGPLPDAPKPAASARRRQLQIRALAQRFSAHVNARGNRAQMRLLPRPLWTYDDSSPDVLSGALFALVGGTTDPEIILLIEARRTAEEPKWYYHPGRFSDKSLFLQYNQRPVWESLRRGHGTDGPNTPDPQYRGIHSGVVAVGQVNQERSR